MNSSSGIDDWAMAAGSDPYLTVTASHVTAQLLSMEKSKDSIYSSRSQIKWFVTNAVAQAR